VGHRGGEVNDCAPGTAALAAVRLPGAARGKDDAAMPRLRRSDCSLPGISRRRHGRGFSYIDADGERVTDPEMLERIRGLGIPPAWRDVWICADPWGHLQATGIDAAGRKQYRYHEAWRARRDQAKFDDMVRFAHALPAVREQVAADLASADEATRERVLACAVRLLDRGFFRIGSEEYTGSHGLATLHKAHVTLGDDGEMVFDYPAKSGARRVQRVSDPEAAAVIARLKRRRSGGEGLLVYRERRGWRDVRSDEVNEYIKDVAGQDFSAKDFRTWNATVLAAVALAAEAAASKTARRRAVTRAVKYTARHLGNTPAVCRTSYIDPRVFDAFRSGEVIAPVLGGSEDAPPVGRRAVEEAVLDLIEERVAA
jgi:DNA topoisomerase IB